MKSVLAPRTIARRIAAGQGGGTLAVPLALHVSARIAERDPEEFVHNPTQLANALRDLIDAIHPDGVPVTDPGVLLSGCRTAADVVASSQLRAAVEATRRLRATFGDAIALVAVLPGPAAIASRVDATGAADAILAMAKELLAAGTDVLVVHDEADAPETSLKTLANVARFHQAAALSHAVARYGLPATTAVDLNAPVRAHGVAVTRWSLARDTDLSVLRDWVVAVRGPAALGSQRSASRRQPRSSAPYPDIAPRKY